MVIKLTKIKDKDKIRKSNKGKQTNMKGKPIKLLADFSTETQQARRQCLDLFQVIKGRTCNQEFSTQQDSRSDSMGKQSLYRQAKEFST